MLKIHSFPLGPLPTYAYLLANTHTKEALLIDAPPQAYDTICSCLTEHTYSLKAIGITHGHWDHYADGAPIQKTTKASIYAHKADKLWMENPLLMKPFAPWGMKIHPLKIDCFLEGGQFLELLGQKIEIRHVPGHAPGNILFYFKEAACAFVGDALFKKSIGRTDLIGGDFELLKQSIKNEIYTLPDDTIIYPGHGEPTSVGYEKNNNPYVR